MTPFESLLALKDADQLSDALESFVARRLAEAGVWPSPRTSDGVPAYRVVERSRDALSVCGHIWQIDQTKHFFWIDAAWSAEGAGEAERPGTATWRLFFDVDEEAMGTPRRARHAMDAARDPRELAWRVTLSGRVHPGPR